jgi:DNA processing protein
VEPALVQETLDLLTLTLLDGLSEQASRALEARGPLSSLLGRPQDHADLLPPAARTALASGAARKAAEGELVRVGRLGARVVGRDEQAYPAYLRAIYDPPRVLYVRGELVAGEETRAVALVGSRGATPQGAALARSMAAELAAAGLAVVSGLARGIDTAAHLGALDSRGRTVAVLGCGLDGVYPPENAGLARRIADAGGAVVTEFRLGCRPLPGHFPKRNRIIAGWGRGVVVVEAAARSGALVTARLALDEGREVMAVPGHPATATAAGANQLIRDGARLVRDARDVAEELGFELAPREPSQAASGALSWLRPDAPASVEDLSARSGLGMGELLAQLTELELQARVRRLPGALYVRA